MRHPPISINVIYVALVGIRDETYVLALRHLVDHQQREPLAAIFAKPSAYPALEPLIAGRINTALIRAHWPEILRVAASIHTGTVAASLILRQLASYPRQNGLAAALR